MANVWERFNSVAKAEDVLESINKRKPLPVGDYEVTLKTIAPAETQKGDPMIKGTFVQKDTGREIYYNQTLIVPAYPQLTDQNIADAVIFLSALVGEEVGFTTMGKFAETIQGIETGTDHVVRVSYANKDTEQKYPKLQVIEPMDETIEDLGLEEF